MQIEDGGEEEEEPRGEGARVPVPHRHSGGSNRGKQWQVALTAAIGSFLFGYDTGVIAGALLYCPYAEDSIYKGLITAMTLVGAIIGGIAGGGIGDRIGRRKALLVGSVMFVAGGGVMVVPWGGLGLLLVGRFLVGIGVGLASLLVPVYLAEMASASQRGTLTFAPQLLISTGILVSYSADLAISLTGTAIPDDWKWRVMLGLSVVPALAQFLSLLALPDSPRWLVSTGRVAEAREILISLRGRGSESAVDEEIRVIQASLVATCTEEAPLFKESINYGTLDSIGRRWERWTKGVRDKLRLLNDAVVLRALFIAIFLQIGQQLSGINAVVYYTPTILERVGVSSLFEHHIGRLSWITPTDAKHAASLLATDIVYVPKIPSIFLAMWLIDRRGRRQLFFAGLSLMIVALGLLVVTSADVIHKEAAQGALAMFGIAFYGCSFVLSMGPLPMIVTSEIFSNEQRGLCAGIAMSANWACNLLVTFLFPVIYDALPQWVPFICFAAACLICLVVVWLFLPETKGVALEDMQELLRRRVVQVPALQKVGKREFDSYHSISQSNGERPGLLND